MEKVTVADFEERVIRADKPVLVDFFAEWCGPCRMMGPILEAVAEEKKDTLQIYKLDVDDNISLAEKYQVSSIPCMILFQNGVAVKRLVGAVSKAELERTLGL